MKRNHLIMKHTLITFGQCSRGAIVSDIRHLTDQTWNHR